MKTHLSVLALCTLFSATMMAQDTRSSGENSPLKAAAGSWVGVSGTVESTSKGTFVLDYGDGNITVNVDPEASNPHEFKANEAVTVYGILDEGFFTATTINARTVYLNSQKSYACSTGNSADEVISFVPAVYAGTLIHGRVTKVDGTNIMVDEGSRMISVDVATLEAEMKNSTGFPEVDAGDLITAVGTMDKGFFTGRTLEATSMEVIH